MVFDFLHEQFLREKCEILVHVGQPLMNKYHSDLRHQKAAPLERLRWYVARAVTANEQTVVKILMTAFSSDLYRSMRLTPRSEQRLQPDNVSLADEVALVNLAVRFTANLASNYSWSQQMFKWTFPFAVAGLLGKLEIGLVF